MVHFGYIIRKDKFKHAEKLFHQILLEIMKQKNTEGTKRVNDNIKHFTQ